MTRSLGLVLCVLVLFVRFSHGLPVGHWAERSNENMVAMYTFEEGEGTLTHDQFSSPKENLELNPNVVSWLPLTTGVTLSSTGTEFAIKSNGTSTVASALSSASSWAFEMWIEWDPDHYDYNVALLALKSTTTCNSGSNGVSILFDGSTAKATYSFKTSTASCTTQYPTLSNLDTAGIHHLIVSSQEESQHQYYLDGTLIASNSRTDSGTLSVAGEIVSIGRLNPPIEMVNFAGKVYFVAFYSSKVIIDQAAANFNAGLPNQPPIAYNSAFETNEDVPFVFQFNGTDAEGRSLDFVILELPLSSFGQIFVDDSAVATTPFNVTPGSTVQFVPKPNVYTKRGGIPVFPYNPVNITFYANEHSPEPGTSVAKRSRTNALVTIDIIEIPDPPITNNQSGIAIFDWQGTQINITGQLVDDYKVNLIAGELISMSPSSAGILKNANLKIDSLPFNVSSSGDNKFSFQLIPFPVKSEPYSDVEFQVRVFDSDAPSLYNGIIQVRIWNSLKALNHTENNVFGGDTIQIQLSFEDQDPNRESSNPIKCFKIFNDPESSDIFSRLFIADTETPIEAETLFCNSGFNLKYVSPFVAAPISKTFSFSIVLNYNTSDASNIEAESTPAFVTINIIKRPTAFNQSGIAIFDWQETQINITGEPGNPDQPALIAGELISMSPSSAGILKNTNLKIDTLPFNVSSSGENKFSFQLIPFPVKSVSYSEVEFQVRVFDNNGPSFNGIIQMRIWNSLKALNHTENNVFGGDTIQIQLSFEDQESDRENLDVRKCFRIFNDTESSDIFNRLSVSQTGAPIVAGTLYCDAGLSVTYSAPSLLSPGQETFSFSIVINYNTSDASDIEAESTPAFVTIHYQAMQESSSSTYVSPSVVIPSQSSSTTSSFDESSSSSGHGSSHSFSHSDLSHSSVAQSSHSVPFSSSSQHGNSISSDSNSVSSNSNSIGSHSSSALRSHSENSHSPSVVDSGTNSDENSTIASESEFHSSTFVNSAPFNSPFKPHAVVVAVLAGVFLIL